jgi:hypothetical protein
MSEDKSNTFEIGLVLAGAVSAGAYTAGVLDFFLEALENYEKVRKKFKEDFPDKPQLHKVQIRVISGASAGGMCGTMLLSTLMDASYKPMKRFNYLDVKDSDIQNNVFYKSWVSKKYGIDISYFLDNEDIEHLDDINELNSILICQRVDSIADDVIERFKKFQKKEYICDELELLLSVFNLNGIDLDLFFDDSKDKIEQFYRITNHSDMMNFKLGEIINNRNKISLNSDLSTELLKKSTLATGAFPLFLQSRTLTKSKEAYKSWKWWTPSSEKSNCSNNGRCFNLINPTFYNLKDEEYDFDTIDGGVANNEPLELARRILAGDDLFDSSDKEKVKKSLIMVDPFSQIKDSYAKVEKNKSKNSDNYLLKRVFDLFTSLKEQARFKPNELSLAMNKDIFSRSLIAPSKDDIYGDKALASSSLGAFGGFLYEKFRQHDFQLGRKNAQSFLKKHFKMGKNNSLVKENIEWFASQGCLIDNEYIQIIPLIDVPQADTSKSITYEIDTIPFDKIKISQKELDKIYQAIEKRVELILKKYLNKMGFFPNSYINLGFLLYGISKGELCFSAKKELKKRIIKMVKEEIDSQLKNRGLKD